MKTAGVELADLFPLSVKERHQQLNNSIFLTFLSNVDDRLSLVTQYMVNIITKYNKYIKS